MKLNTMPNANNIYLPNPNMNTNNNTASIVNTPSYKKETLHIKTSTPIFTELNNNCCYTRYIKPKQVMFPSFKDVSKKLHFNYEYEDPLALGEVVTKQQNETMNTQDGNKGMSYMLSRNENKSQNEELSLKQGDNDNNT